MDNIQFALSDSQVSIFNSISDFIVFYGLGFPSPLQFRFRNLRVDTAQGYAKHPVKATHPNNFWLLE